NKPPQDFLFRNNLQIDSFALIEWRRADPFGRGRRFSSKTTEGSQMGANMLAGVTGLLIVAGVTQVAHAEFTFRNDTSERVVFNLQCRNASFEALSIDANRSRTY